MSNVLRLTDKDLADLQKRGYRVHGQPAPGVDINAVQPPKNKFNAVKTADGDSLKESRRLQELRLLAKAGQIHDLIPHVTFLLVPSQKKPDGKRERPIKYTCDALYVENGRLVVEETKSEVTKKQKDYPMRRKLMLERHGIVVREN